MWTVLDSIEHNLTMPVTCSSVCITLIISGFFCYFNTKREILGEIWGKNKKHLRPAELRCFLELRIIMSEWKTGSFDNSYCSTCVHACKLISKHFIDTSLYNTPRGKIRLELFKRSVLNCVPI